mmetsp:Transcript_126192/g.403346  ORF Transcript_126192/g.403346 Transcript_126192/m.403346 type:complete len:145 (-) Transcript_126192:123-557(-)
MGGSFSCSGVRDAYGGYLEEGDYVECTTTGGAKQSLGRVKYIHEDRVTFQWPLFGTYTYTDSDIRYYGVSKVMGDRDGYKFKMDQIVELLDGTEAWVSLYSPQSVTLNFSQMGEARLDVLLGEGLRRRRRLWRRRHPELFAERR